MKHENMPEMGIMGENHVFLTPKTRIFGGGVLKKVKFRARTAGSQTRLEIGRTKIE